MLHKLLSLLLVVQLATAQSFTIVGTVQEAGKDQGVAAAAVYLNGTSFFAETDTAGHFTIKNVPSARYQLVVSIVGYQTHQQGVLLTADIDGLVISLKPQITALDEVTIKAKKDKKWEKNLKRFETEFLGVDDFSKKCVIKNAYVLSFEENQENGVFSATATAPLEIENQALGYKVVYDLRKFQVSNSFFSSQGFSRFEDLSGDMKKYIENRNAAYIGSDKHFFRALVNGRLKEEGYRAFKVDDKFKGNGNFSLLNPQLGKRLKPLIDSQVVGLGRRPGFFKVRTDVEWEIINTNTILQENSYKDAPHPISWMLLKKPEIEVSAQGIVQDPTAVVWAGDISQKRLANLLPLDFSPSISGKAVTETPTAAVANQIDEARPVGQIFHAYKGDTLYLKISFPDYDNLAGKVSVSVIENFEKDFAPEGNPEEIKADTTTKKSKSFEGKTTDLQEVTVKSKKFEKKGSTVFATADYVLKTEDFAGKAAVTSVFTALQSRIPGVRIVERPDDSGVTVYKIDIRGSSSSSFSSNPPLILINGMPFSQNAMDLNSISMQEVSKIEVFKRVNAAFGMRGAGGAINVVMKSQAPMSVDASGKKTVQSDFRMASNVAFDEGDEVAVKFHMPISGLNYDIMVTGNTTAGQSFFLSKKITLK